RGCRADRGDPQGNQTCPDGGPGQETWRPAMSASPIDLVIGRLKSHGCNPRENGSGQWRSRCPCHEGKSSNLSITTGDDGRVLLNCHHEETWGKSCSAESVARSLGLDLSDLFPPKAGAAPRPKATTGKAARNGAAYPSPEKAIEVLAKTLGKPTGQWPYREP